MDTDEKLWQQADTGSADDVRALIEQGADVNGARGSLGINPLLRAAAHGNDEVVLLLLDAQADVEATNQEGHTALHEAAGKGQTSTAALLLEHGADVNARSKAELTPLHSAAAKGHAETVTLLLDWGADRDARARNGWTALEMANANGQPATAQLLSETVQAPPGGAPEAGDADQDEVEKLIAVVKDKAAGHNPRIYAVKDLGRLGDARAVDALVEAMRDSADENVQYWAALALGALGETAVEPLIACTKDADKWVRSSAVIGLNATDSPRAKEAISACANDPDDEVRSWADAVLSGARNPRL